MPNRRRDSLHDALERLPARPAVLTPPRLATRVREAVENLPWTVTPPAVIPVDGLPTMGGSGLWLLFPITTEKETP